MLRLFLQAYVVEPDFATQFINEWVKRWFSCENNVKPAERQVKFLKRASKGENKVLRTLQKTTTSDNQNPTCTL
ncbi:hypothetical protein PAJ34TS1_05220 [Paenibacillus azoreducens]|uniref:Uncharacterized protein n=1 Tax=Paenibacillus azoreducens TaxID=116718 RepID=A0A919YB23_9BACL|nr:hypothetical protein J34TS1_22110 [Paenibacillus azoreducens]